jgi:hypothetical protein
MRLKLIILILLFPAIAFAGVDLPYSTTYDCDDWDSSMGEPTNCPGITKYLDGSCGDQSLYETISSASNNPAGEGYKGQRHYMGDGTNENGGGTDITLNSPQNEIWFRFYMKYSSGFAWDAGETNPLSYDKIIYIDVSGSYSVIFEFRLWSRTTIWTEASGGLNYDCNTGREECLNENFANFVSVNGGYTGDGQWHMYEIYLNNQTDTAKVWIDETLIYHRTDIDFEGAGTHPGFQHFVIGSNQGYPDNCTGDGQCCSGAYADFDDIAISNTGYIGSAGPPATADDISGVKIE